MRISLTALQSPSRPASQALVVRRRPLVFVASIGLLVAGGCSDEGEAGEPSAGDVASAAVGSVPATDIAGRPLVTTTQPTAPSTRASVTVVASTVVASRPPGTTSTLAPQSSEAAVMAAVGRAERMFLETMRDPELTVDDGLEAIQAVTAPGSAARSSFESTFLARRGMSLALVESEQVPFTITAVGDVLMIAVDEALVQVCVVDSDVIVRIELDANGDEEQRVVGDATVTARWSKQRFVVNEGQWLLASSDVIAEYPGETECPSE